VIGVVVRYQDRVRFGNSAREKLKPELRRRVDEDLRATVALYECAYTRSLVTLVGGSANRAVASDLRNAEARSRSEKGELQRTRPAFIRSDLR